MSARPVSRDDVRRLVPGMIESEFDLFFVSPLALLGGETPADLVDQGRGGEIVALLAPQPQQMSVGCEVTV